MMMVVVVVVLLVVMMKRNGFTFPPLAHSLSSIYVHLFACLRLFARQVSEQWKAMQLNSFV